MGASVAPIMMMMMTTTAGESGLGWAGVGGGEGDDGGRGVWVVGRCGVWVMGDRGGWEVMVGMDGGGLACCWFDST